MTLVSIASITVSQGLFIWRWGTPGRWDNPPVHIISHFHVYMIGGVTRHMLPHLSGVPHLHVNRPTVCSSSGSKKRLCTVYFEAQLDAISERCQSEGLALVKGLEQQCMHWSYEFMKIIYETCGMKDYTKEDHRNCRRNFCSCEKRAWKKKKKKTGLYGIQAWNGNPVQAWIFFRLSFRSCKRWVHNCDDLLSYMHCPSGQDKWRVQLYLLTLIGQLLSK